MAKKTKRGGPEKQAVEAKTPVEIKALSVCAAHGNRPDELLEILHALQHEIGYIPDSVLPIIANAINRSRAEVYGVITFYHDFKRQQQGRHAIKICRAEACQSMNADALCKHAEAKFGTAMGTTTKDGAYTLEAVYCLGNCALSPAMLIGDALYGKVDPKRFDAIVADLDKEAAA